jgi:hypothetical protein
MNSTILALTTTILKRTKLAPTLTSNGKNGDQNKFRSVPKGVQTVSAMRNKKRDQP